MAKVDLPVRENEPQPDPDGLRERFPSNTQKEKRVRKVTEGKVVKRKKGLGRKLEETIIGDSADNVKDYIIWDVLVPALKETISDAVSGGIQMLLFGEKHPSTRGNVSRDRGTSYVSYSSYYNRDKPVRPREGRSTGDSRVRRSIETEEIILETRGEAESVLDSLMDIIDNYGEASVADLFELVGIPSEYTDNRYGWENLSMARVDRIRGGYLLNLPKAHALD